MALTVGCGEGRLDYMATALLLHDWHGEGVTYEAFTGWAVPWRFRTLEEDYAQMRNHAALIDFSHMGLIEVRGVDRTAFLHNLLSQDIATLKPGQGAPSALLRDNGSLVSDCLVLAEAESLLLLCDAHRATAIVEALDHHLFSEQVVIHNHERREAIMGILGPATNRCVKKLLGSLPNLDQVNTHRVVMLKDTPIRIIRWSLGEKEGFLLQTRSENAGQIWKQALALPDCAAIGWEALHIARIEAGIPWFGIDMDEANLILETGLEKSSVSYTKGCYLGQEVVARLDSRGSVSKKLMKLHFEGSLVPENGDKLFQGSEEVGMVTSACYSPMLRQPIALGYVKRPLYKPEAELEAESQGSRIKGRIEDLS